MSATSLDELYDIRSASNPSVSSDGKHVVYSVAANFKSDEHVTASIWTAHMDEELSAHQLTDGLYNDRSPQYAPGGEQIAFLSDRSKAGETCAIYLLSAEGRELSEITAPEHERAISRFQWSPDGAHIAFLSADERTSEQKGRDAARDDAEVFGEHWQFAKLRLLHVETKNVQIIASGDYHITNFAWSPLGDRIVYTSTRNPRVDSSAEGGTMFHCWKATDSMIAKVGHIPGWVNGAPIYLDEDRVLFISGATITANNSSQCVYQLDSRTQDWARVSHGEVNDVPMMAAGRRATVVLKVEDGLFDHLETSSGEVCSEKGMTVSAFDVFAERDQIVSAVVSSANCAPPELFAVSYERSTKSVATRQLSQHAKKLNEQYQKTARPVYCKAVDGTQLDAIFMKPESVGGEKPSLPTVVFVHGGPYYRSQFTFDPTHLLWTQVLVANGYAVLFPNYRGGSGHGDAFARWARGGAGTVDYSDMIDITRAAIAEGLVHREKVVIGGWSQGGFLSYLAVTRRDFRFKGAICGAGVSDWDMHCMTSDVPFWQEEVAGTTPWQSRAEETKSRHGSAIWHLRDRKDDEEKTPVLILHGKEDQRVPLGQAIAFHRACLALKWPCEFVAYPREGHFITEKRHAVDMAQRVLDFVNSQIESPA